MCRTWLGRARLAIPVVRRPYPFHSPTPNSRSTKMLVSNGLEVFAKFCTVERQLSTNTVLAYRNDLADYARWLAGHVQQNDGTADALRAYLEHMIAERKLAAATVRRRIACLRAFFR